MVFVFLAHVCLSCHSFKAVGSGATRLLLKPDSNVKLIGAVETGSLGALTHRELDGLSSQAYRANVEAYLATHCCATDEVPNSIFYFVAFFMLLDGVFCVDSYKRLDDA